MQVNMTVTRISNFATSPPLQKAGCSIAREQKKKIKIAFNTPLNAQPRNWNQLNKMFCTPYWYNRGNYEDYKWEVSPILFTIRIQMLKFFWNFH